MTLGKGKVIWLVSGPVGNAYSCTKARGSSTGTCALGLALEESVAAGTKLLTPFVVLPSGAYRDLMSAKLSNSCSISPRDFTVGSSLCCWLRSASAAKSEAFT